MNEIAIKPGQGFEVGGPNAYKVKAYPRGGFGLAFHWVNEEPAMVVFPLDKALKGDTGGVYILPLDNCHELVLPGTKGEGVNGRALFDKANVAAAVIGRAGDVFVARAIADALLENLDALCDMPPEPEWLALKRQAAPVGMAKFLMAERVNGKRGELQLIDEREI